MLKLLKFHAPWCAPCKTFGPIVKEVSDNFNITLQSIDTDAEESAEIIKQYNVRSLPTVILVDDDIEVARHVGLIPRTKFSEWLTESKNKKSKK